MAYALYQDPMQSQPMVVPDTGIGLRLVPKQFSLTDPVLLRHVLCMMNLVRNIFHVYLCWRQLRTCNWTKEPPRKLQDSLSRSAFNTTKDEEMYSVESLLLSYIFDSIFCWIELYFGVYPALWRAIIRYYGIVDDLIWQSIAYVALFSSYMVARRLPQIFYSKLVLSKWYGINREKSMSLVGLLCFFSLLLVMLQVILIPLTPVFLYIESHGGRFFVLWIWGFLFVVTIAAFAVFSLFGLPCIGTTTKLVEGDLYSSLTDILDVFGFPPGCVYIIRTFDIDTATAYAWNCCCRQRVFIFENLLFNQGRPLSELLPEEIGKGLHSQEVVAYIAHELAHSRLKHVVKTFCMLHASLLVYLMIFGTCYHETVIYEAAGFSASFYPPIVGYWLVYKYVMPLYLTITNWIIFYFLRKFEYSADKYVFNLGYGDVLSTAFLKLFEDGPVFPVVDPLYMMWHRSRPTFLQRIHRLSKLRKSKMSGS
ncbi:CAAX prenyl protease 1 homolog [Drosophila grimshawi]|uniref:GH14290 n=1 Tax=Drosophila grimshawi TaxID=7222 RepID=B4JYH3_DROGR|nr:CAAX prenyl protease 1 homolog [Drosophila grimshawi]EDV90735.1 GH14290 [Drosophila grimshawi]